MKKSIFSIILIILGLCFGLTGCGNAIPEMTEKENSLITSYAAGLLLKYDSRYQTKLLNEEELAKEEELQRQIQEEAEKKAALEAEKEAKKKEEDKEAQKNGGTKYDITSTNPAEILGLDGFEVSYVGVDYMDSYPDSGDDLFFALPSTDGRKWAVVRLVLTNTTSEARTADILNLNARFKISFNGGDFHNVNMTMLSDDFSVYSGEVQSGESVNTVLLLDLKEEECVEVNSIVMYIKCNGETARVQM